MGARRAWDLVRASHPGPSLAVTGIAAGLTALAGLHLSTGIVVTFAVFTGQLSIGWANDRIDADRDQLVQRRDKPMATGALRPAVVNVAIAIALAATVALSLSLGYRAGLIALLTVACGWGYNLGLKNTIWSAATFAVAFGLLPAIVTLASEPPRWPAGWTIAAGAQLGVAAHFANVLPDLRDDAATGVRGLPHRLGSRVSVVLVPALLVGASAVIVFVGTGGPGGRSGWFEWWRWGALGGCAALAAVGLWAGLSRPSSRVFFVATVAVAALDLVLFGLSGARLT
jgi:4-hydroxybenzoate polyprenyltransferase